MEVNQLLKKYVDRIKKAQSITPDSYVEYDVKRGLRNKDATGVLVGLTEIGEVHGYIIDEGDKIPQEGRLRYRGISVKDLVDGFQNENRFGFEETAFLLLFGFLPSKEDLDEFDAILKERRLLPEYFTEDMILKAPSENIMNKLARSILASYSSDPDPENSSIENVLSQSITLIARFPAMVAYAYQAKQRYFNNSSLFLHPQRRDLSTAENFLHMIRSNSKFTPLEAEILDLCLVLHAEHGGGNNSAFTVHVVSSADTDTYSAIAAGVGSLKGYKHGGANIKVYEMMENIKKNVKKWDDEGQVADYLTKILQKKVFDRSGLIYGQGHAVYTKSDPRAVLLKEKAQDLAHAKGKTDEFLLYQLIEKLSPEVFYKVKGSKKEISSNVDFYSGFVYTMLGIPNDLFTSLFAISRVAGWCAHRIEELVVGGKIYRPAYKSILGQRDYIPLSERK